MIVELPYGTQRVPVEIPNHSLIYRTSYPPGKNWSSAEVSDILASPLGSASLHDAVESRNTGPVVIVISDTTRPVPYKEIVPPVLATLRSAGVDISEVVFLVATGMHRSTTIAEKEAMLGEEIAGAYRVEDHTPDEPRHLVRLPGTTASGAPIEINRIAAEAGFLMTIGLVEPHFMAGFSGGRKSICPGLSSMHTIQRFHGYSFLSNPRADTCLLEGNPCHEEALSVARAAGVDFTINAVINKDKEMVALFAGTMEQAHAEACRFVKKHGCAMVQGSADLVITSCGGAPLDTTFYQCVKGLVSCVPAVKPGGKIIALGSCSEGVGSREYTDLLVRYANRWQQFIDDISTTDIVQKDQWQLQMHTRALQRVGQENLIFFTDGLSEEVLSKMSVSGVRCSPSEIAQRIRRLIRELPPGATVGCIPEGPYCALM